MLWLRVLDVPAALAARRYPVTDRIVLRVHDPDRSRRRAAGRSTRPTRSPRP